jgi:hypothetical protein
MQPLRPRRRLLDRLGKLRRDEGREGRIRLAAGRRACLRDRTLDNTRHDANLTSMEVHAPTRLWHNRFAHALRANAKLRVPERTASLDVRSAGFLLSVLWTIMQDTELVRD